MPGEPSIIIRDFFMKVLPSHHIFGFRQSYSIT